MKLFVGLSAAVAFGIMVLGTGGCRAQREATTVLGSLTGILAVTGTEPFTDLSLQTMDGRMHVICKDTSALLTALRGLQGKKVRLFFRVPGMRSDSSMIIVERYDLVTER